MEMEDEPAGGGPLQIASLIKIFQAIGLSPDGLDQSSGESGLQKAGGEGRDGGEGEDEGESLVDDSTGQSDIPSSSSHPSLDKAPTPTTADSSFDDHDLTSQMARFQRDAIEHTLEAQSRDQDQKERTDVESTGPQLDKSASRRTLSESEFKVLQETFGKEEDEQVLGTVASALLREEVVVVGAIFVTTRRFLFAAKVYSSNDSTIIKSGYVRVHSRGRFSTSKQHFIVLTPQHVAVYASAKKADHYKPIRLTHLSDIKHFDVLPESHRIHLGFHSDRAPCTLSYDTIEGATTWKRELDGARYRLKLQKEHVKVSIPLARLRDIGRQPYLNIMELMTLRFDAREDYAEGTDGEPSNWHELRFALFPVNTHIIDTLEEALRLYKKSTHTGRVPLPLVDLEDEADEEQLKLLRQSTDEKKHHLSAAKTRVVELFLIDPLDPDLFMTHCAWLRALPICGILAISQDSVIFYRESVLGDTKLRLPANAIKAVAECKAFGLHRYALLLKIHGRDDHKFEFSTEDKRDRAILAVATLRQRCSERKSSAQSLASEDQQEPLAEVIKLQKPQPMQDTEIPIVANLAGPVKDRLISPKRFYCMTIGSRGDVQPYIALCKELQSDNHHTRIVTHPEYKEWVESFGIEHRSIGGDPAVLMKLSVEHKMFSPEFFKETLGNFRQWFDDLLREAWEGCQGADVLLESPSTFAGIHIAEALGIPYFRCFTMPWTRTSEYPHAFFVAGTDLGSQYNASTYTMYETVIWQATSGQINKWRKQDLGLRATTASKLHARQVPFIYNFSSYVVPYPHDWKDYITISGYWFLDTVKTWEPPKELLDFLEMARATKRKVIYVGFGSIIVKRPNELTQKICESVENAGVCAVVSRGWSSRLSSEKSGDSEPPTIPKSVLAVDSVPHDWLFSRIDAACHHGGAGTTGASLRAGLPTIIKPFFGDQFFWAQRIQKLGVGVSCSKLSVSELTAAFKEVTLNRVMMERAQEIGERIRSENGVRVATLTIYSYLAYALHRGADQRRASRDISIVPALRRGSAKIASVVKM